MNKRAFTLAEIIVVIIIISGLMFLLVPNIINTKTKIEEKTCFAYIELVNAQIQAYYLEYSSYPESLETLVLDGYIKSTTCPNGKIIYYENHKAYIDE